jgi:hypothetical protein
MLNARRTGWSDELNIAWVDDAPTRINHHGPPPYQDDNDDPFAMVLVPASLNWEGEPGSAR